MMESFLYLLPLFGLAVLVIILISSAGNSNPKRSSKPREEDRTLNDPDLFYLQDPLHQFDYPQTSGMDTATNHTVDLPTIVDTNIGFGDSDDCGLGALGDNAANSISSDT